MRRAVMASPGFPNDAQALFDDCRHPSALGHAFLAQLIDHLVSQMRPHPKHSNPVACKLVPWDSSGETSCFFGDALKALAKDASNYRLAEYAPKKLALVPTDNATRATIRLRISRPASIMLGVVVSWRARNVSGIVRCIDCECQPVGFSHWHAQRSTVSIPLRLVIYPPTQRAQESSTCALELIEPPRITAVIPARPREYHWPGLTTFLAEEWGCCAE